MSTAAAPIQVSFEFFPPADAAMETTLWNSLQRLAPLAPRFVSVTYGADGSTRERTHNVVTRIQQRTALTGAPHLTCVGAARGEILDIARAYWDEGVRHLVAKLTEVFDAHFCAEATGRFKDALCQACDIPLGAGPAKP